MHMALDIASLNIAVIVGESILSRLKNGE